VLRAADRVVFPGVGAIRDCMAEIRRLHCDELLDTALREQHKPVLAICVGMQALMQRSEENGGVDCLGFVDGEVRFFGAPLARRRRRAPEGAAHGLEPRVPALGAPPVAGHRGRRTLLLSCTATTCMPQIVPWWRAAWTTAWSADAALARDNLFAVQFHPEKSHRRGCSCCATFIDWDGTC
jgi:glutamine amidotransferase